MKLRIKHLLRFEPIGLFFLLVVTFGLFFPWLGFYWDDWPVLLTAHMQGTEGYWQFYQYDRPVSAWTYVLTQPILGENPFAWHMFTLVMRWLTTVALWWAFLCLWPRQRRAITWTAVLFAVYPVFTQQAISVAYSQHWICYFLYCLSLGAMICAWRKPRWFWPLTGLGLAAALLQIFTMEYYVGLEFLRPILLGVVIFEQKRGTLDRVKTVLLGWAPYLLGLIGFVIWRVFLLTFPEKDENAPGLLYQIFTDPAAGLLRLFQNAAQDFVYLVSTIWANTLSPASIDFYDRFILFSWGLGLLTAGVSIALLLFHLKSQADEETEQPRNWGYQALIIGCTAVVLGLLPVWLTDRQVIVGLYSDRFGLPAMLGASLALVGLLDVLIADRRKQVVVLSVLIGLSVGFLMRSTNEYRWVRIQQNRFYWQLYWRAPAIKPQTALLAEGEVLSRMGLYSTSAGINLIYAQPSPDGQLPYWFYSISREYAYKMYELASATKIEHSFRHFTFHGNTHDSLIVYFEPVDANCLRIVSPQDFDDPHLGDYVRQALPAIDLSRIESTVTANSAPSPYIFGPEPEHGWCYYFEKADLARQMQDWQKVAELGDQAQALGYTMKNSQSNTPQEWIPFIEGYAFVGRWEEAQEITRATLERDSRMGERMCDVWRNIGNTSQNSEQVQGTLQEIDCGNDGLLNN